MTDPILIPRFKKERFLLTLSEDEFRDTVVRPLLLRLGYGDGRDLCGPQEAGKDAIFTDRNRLGLTDLVAVQTKKGALNLASKATQNLAVAATQIKTALETGVSLIGTKQTKKPASAILCASGKINDAARAHIVAEVSSPNIRFLDSDELIPLLDSHLPEVWRGVNVELLPYFEAIKRLVEEDSIGLSDTASPGSTVFGVAASDVRFVTLKLFRTKIVTRKRRGKVEKHTDIEEFPLTGIERKRGARFLITGEAGSGKSTALLRLAYLMALRGMTEGNYSIPILVRASDVYISKPQNMSDLCDLAEKMITGKPHNCFSSDDLVAGRVILLIDSLDELATDVCRTAVLETIDAILIPFPKVRVIVTSRPSAFAEKVAETTKYENFRINSLSWRQAQKILTTVKTGKKLPAHQATELLRRLEKLHGIELNPLLVTVFAATTDFSKQDIPANITELFKKFTELMLGRWDESKGLKHQYQAQVKDFILTKIAFALHMDNRTQITRDEAEGLARRELVARGYEADAGLLLTEIFDRSGLFRTVSEGIEFRHLLLQEFFAGRAIENIEQVKLLVTSEWWQRALIFYFGDNPTRVDQLGTLSQSIPTNSASEIVTAASTIGLALQACYLSPVEAKIRVWKWVVDTLGESRDAYIESFAPDNDRRLIPFITHYLITRDSVALTNLKGAVAELTQWARNAPSLAEKSVDARTYWLIVGLIESGELDEAEALVKSYRPEDTRLLLPIHMGAYFVSEIRPSSQADRESAKRIVRRLNEAIAGFVPKIVKEFESTLLELRDGEPLSIEHERESEE